MTPRQHREAAEKLLDRSEKLAGGSPMAQHLLLAANAHATLAVEARLAALDAAAKRAPAKRAAAKKTARKAADDG